MQFPTKIWKYPLSSLINLEGFGCQSTRYPLAHIFWIRTRTFGRLVEHLTVSLLSRLMWEYPPWSITPCHPTRPAGSGDYILDVGSFCDIVGERVNCCLWDVCDIVQGVFQSVLGFPALLFWVVWCFPWEMCPWVSCGWCINWYHISEEGMLVGFQPC